MAQERIVFPPLIIQSQPMNPRSIMATNFRPFATSFTKRMFGRVQPNGMQTSMMANLHTGPSTFTDNITSAYSLLLALRSAIGNLGWTMQPQVGVGLGSRAMPIFTTNFVIQ